MEMPCQIHYPTFKHDCDECNPELKAERGYESHIGELESALAKAQEQLRVAVEALEPFAKISGALAGQTPDFAYIGAHIEDYHKARAALEQIAKVKG